MKKTYVLQLGLVAVLAAGLTACSPKPADDAPAQAAAASAAQQPLQAVAQSNSSEWAGVYRGELPCPNCDYIEAELTLNPDLSYAFQSRHVGRVAGEMPATRQGVFHWRDDGLVQLDDAADNMVFFVGKGALEMRGADGKAYPDRHGKICRLQQTAAFDARK